MIKHTLALTPLLLLLTSCSTLSGSIDNNRYTSPDGKLSADIPPLPIEETRDGSDGKLHYVDFTPSGYWQAACSLHIQWFHQPDVSYERQLQSLPKVMTPMFESAGGQFTKTPVCKTIQVKGIRSLQCLAEGVKDSEPAGFAGTVVPMKGQLVYVYMIYPMERQAPMRVYNQLINSIKLN